MNIFNNSLSLVNSNSKIIKNECTINRKKQ